ncbi:glycosyl hydrolase [Nonlabens dokdonensis DSW-6]|uniref:Glycosyl hydrolase n=2 Tax=Nonlabens dokdonensis TaxID=328515 RepID=L7W5H7_NONDD|nr:glycosyl hydrolase [Nonlabens dokdonensis DSW-6]
MICAVVLVERYSFKRSRKQPSNSYLHDRISKFEVQGIDISQHQGEIEWKDLSHPNPAKTIDFIFMRASVGIENDTKYQENWKKARNQNFKLGAYHYYWSNVNSAKQAAVFIKQVDLKKGDLPPVLDIEDISDVQNKKSLRKGLKNWIRIIEAHYNVKPIIYSGEAFYRDVLMPDIYFKNYPRIWIANYNKVKSPRISWSFWQFTDRMPVNGIQTLVDGNVYKDSQANFNKLFVP